MKPVVFLGPSLSVKEAKQYLDAEYLPPCAMGDVLRCLNNNPSAILIVDGFFEQCPAVWHKEILFALSEGTPVYGCSSMGALRAAELHSFGMIGLGKIFEDFASCRLEDDDEVTVVHSEQADGYRPVSEAMVNIRYALNEALKLGLLTDTEVNTLVQSAKSMFYPKRNWQALIQVAANFMDGDAHSRFSDWVFGGTRPNQKGLDAITALQQLAQDLKDNKPFEVPDFDFEPTCYWDKVVDEYSSVGDGQEGSVQTRSLLNHARLFSKDKTQLLKNALLISLVEKDLTSIPFSTEQLHQAMTVFRRNRGLNSPQQLQQWMQSNELDEAATIALIELEYKLDIHLASKQKNIDKHLLNVMKLSGQYGTALAGVVNKLEQKANSFNSMFFGETEAVQEDALVWYQNNFDVISEELDLYVKKQGIDNVKVFMDELMLEYSTAQQQELS